MKIKIKLSEYPFNKVVAHGELCGKLNDFEMAIECLENDKKLNNCNGISVAHGNKQPTIYDSSNSTKAQLKVRALEKNQMLNWLKMEMEKQKTSGSTRVSKKLNLKALSWNVGLGSYQSSSSWWSWWGDEVLGQLDLKKLPYDIIFLQEVPYQGANPEKSNPKNTNFNLSDHLFFKDPGRKKYEILEKYNIGITAKGNVFFATLIKKSSTNGIPKHIPVSMSGYLPFALITMTDTFILVNVHLKSNRKKNKNQNEIKSISENNNIRIDQINCLEKSLSEINPQKIPVIIGGDFNGHDPTNWMSLNWIPNSDTYFYEKNKNKIYDYIGAADITGEVIDINPKNKNIPGYHRPLNAQF